MRGGERRTADQRTSGPADQRTGGPADRRTGGPADQRTAGPADQRTSGPANRRTSGPADRRTSGPDNRTIISLFPSGSQLYTIYIYMQYIYIYKEPAALVGSFDRGSVVCLNSPKRWVNSGKSLELLTYELVLCLDPPVHQSGKIVPAPTRPQPPRQDPAQWALSWTLEPTARCCDLRFRDPWRTPGKAPRPEPEFTTPILNEAKSLPVWSMPGHARLVGLKQRV